MSDDDFDADTYEPTWRVRWPTGVEYDDDQVVTKVSSHSRWYTRTIDQIDRLMSIKDWVEFETDEQGRLVCWVLNNWVRKGGTALPPVLGRQAD